MTFTEIVNDVCGRLNLTTAEAIARVGTRVNQRYKRVTMSLGLADVFRRTTTGFTTTIGTRTQVVNGIEKVTAVINLGVENSAPLNEIAYEEMLARIPSSGAPSAYAIKRMGSSSVTLYFDSTFAAAVNLSIEGEANASTLSGGNVPAFSETYHEILVYGVLADELRKKEKIQLARDAEGEYERMLSELRMMVAVSAYKDVVQGKVNTPPNQNTMTSGGGGGGGDADDVFLQLGTGAVQRTMLSKAREQVSILDYGAVAGGTTDCTAALTAACTYLHSLGGGVVLVPPGTYLLRDFTFASFANIIVRGMSQGYGYDAVKTSSNFTVPAGTWGIRFPRTSAFCGLENIGLVSTGVLNGSLPHVATTDGVEYGVLIESPATTMYGVTVYGFMYGCVIANEGNANIIDSCVFLFNTRVGFAVAGGTAGTYAAYHPNLVAPATPIASTVFTVKRTQIRRNGWGIILRGGAGHFEDVIVESNYFGGVYEYVGTLDASVSGNWTRCFFENNWSDYDTTAAYTINQNRLLQETLGVWVPFATNANTALNEAGYQFGTGSVATGSSAGPNLQAFYDPTFSLGTNQKALYLKSSFITTFYRGSCTGGDQTNAIRLSNGAWLSNATHFWDWNGTLPATYGNRGNSISSERSDVEAVGGVTISPGYFRGLAGNVLFPVTQVPSADANMLDDYEEGTWTPVLGGATSESGQTYATRQAKYVKIGRLVVASFYVVLSVVGTVTGNAQIKGLPFAHETGLTEGGAIGYWIGLGTNVISVGYRLDSAATVASLWYSAAAGASVTVAPNTFIQSGANLEMAGTICYYAGA